MTLAVAAATQAGTNQWTTQGIDGGHVVAAAYVPTASGAALAAGGGQLWRTTDNGVSWTPTAAIANDASIAVNPANPNIVAVVGPGGQGLFRSSDGGVTFTGPIRFAQNANEEQTVSMSGDGQVWYGAALLGYVFRSADQGRTWEARSNGLPSGNLTYPHGIVVDPTNADRAFAMLSISGASSSARVIYQTTNGGLNWAPLANLNCESVQCLDIAIAPWDTDRLIVMSHAMAYTSGDNGANWTSTMMPHGLAALEFDPLQEDHAYAVSYRGEIVRTTTAGASWSPLPRVHTTFVGSITFDRLQAGRLMLATSEGVLVSTDSGATWVNRSSGIRASSMIGLTAAADESNRVLAVGHAPFGVLSRNGQNGTWPSLGKESMQQQALNEVSTRVVAMDPTNPDVLYVGGGAGLLKSIDGGGTWFRPSPIFDNVAVTAIAIDPVDPQRLYAATYPTELYQSLNGGATWFAAAAGLTLDVIQDLMIEPSDPQIMYAGGWGPNQSYLLKSVNRGADWASSASGLQGRPVFKLLAHPASFGLLYAVTSESLVRSTNAGQTWTVLPGTGSVTDVALSPSQVASIYRVRGRSIVERSVDFGATWESIPVVSADAIVRGIALDPARGSNVIAAIDNVGFGEFEIAPDLALSTTATTIAVEATQTVALRAQNNGAYSASDVELVTTLPAAAASVSAQTDRGSCTVNNGEVRCLIGLLRPGQQANASIVLSAPSAAATLLSTLTAHEADPVAANNALTISTERVADVSIAANASTNAVTSGDSFSYALRVVNAGPSPASALRVTGQLPASAEISAASGPSATCAVTAGTVACDIASLANGASVDIRVDVRSGSAGSAALTASISSVGVDPVAANNSVTSTVTVQARQSGGSGGGGGGGGGALHWSALAGLLWLVTRRRSVDSREC